MGGVLAVDKHKAKAPRLPVAAAAEKPMGLEVPGNPSVVVMRKLNSRSPCEQTGLNCAWEATTSAAPALASLIVCFLFIASFLFYWLFWGQLC